MNRLILFPLFAMLLIATANVQAQDRDFTKRVQPFFKKHCLRCHGTELEEGGVRVDELEWDVNDLDSIDELQNILDEIVVGSMPPQDEDQPSAKDLKAITELLSLHIEKAREKHSSGGGKPVRRLTKTEFVNTLYDLLGVRINAEDIPHDGITGGFDTAAVDLYTTDMHLETFLAAARIAARRFVASRNMEPGRKKAKTRTVPNYKKNRQFFAAKDVPPAGYQIMRLVCWKKNPKTMERIFFGPQNNAIYEITGSRKSPQFVDRIFYEAKTEQWTPNKDIEIDQVLAIQVINAQPWRFFEGFRKRYGDQVPDTAAGPMLGEFATLMNRGRKVDGKFVLKLLNVFRMGRQQGEPFWEAIVEPMALTMCSMESMFHFESRGNADENPYVSPVEMVNRISYFLWRSAPDAELIELAKSKKWYEPKVRNAQYRRMLEDKKFERFLNDFTVQWLELDRQDLIAVDDRVFRDFDNSAKASLKEETVQFVSHVIRRNLPLKTLIDSDFMMVNNKMAIHYGLPAISGDEFRKIPVPKGSGRGGLLTHAGIMMQTGTGDRTSIVERGAFVARKFLNDPPGPPPPLVDDLPTEGRAVETMTAAQLVMMHRKSPQCASCHTMIDNIGMGMEELDGVGIYRTVDMRLSPNIENLNKRQRRNPDNFVFQVPLRTDGKVGARKFRGVAGLKNALLSKDKQLAEAYVEALLAMANGRESGVADESIVDEIIESAEKDDLRALSILIAVLKSEAFQTH